MISYKELYKICVDWVEKKMVKFTANDLKIYLKTTHKTELTSLQLGRIFQNLSADEIVKFHEFVRSKDSRNKSCYTKVWISINYSKKQAENASIKGNNLKLEL